jgi:AraC-like DNA-binding protein
MLMGPLIWFYTQSMTDGAFKFWPKYKWHVVPALLIFLVYLLLWIAPRDTQLAFLSTPFEPVFGHLEQIMALSFAMMYWGLSVGHFRTWKHSLMSNNYVKIKWMQRFFAVVAAFVILWLSLIFINYWLYDFGVATVTYNPLWVAISAVLLWLGFEVFSNPKFFLLTKKTNGAILNKVEPEDLALYQKKLHDLMVEQKLYIDPTLSLNKLAKAMDTNPRFLSSLINGGLGTTFYDLINRYRIDEVKRLLKDPSNKNLTIEAIAHHAGFNSKSTFNSAFKKFNQMTPREFIKGHLNGDKSN